MGGCGVERSNIDLWILGILNFKRKNWRSNRYIFWILENSEFEHILSSFAYSSSNCNSSRLIIE